MRESDPSTKNWQGREKKEKGGNLIGTGYWGVLGQFVAGFRANEPPSTFCDM
jgi:hypothetical protein